MENYKEYSKEELIELLEYIDRPVEIFDDVCLRLCEALSCKSCPVCINGLDKRTEEDENNHKPCYKKARKAHAF